MIILEAALSLHISRGLKFGLLMLIALTGAYLAGNVTKARSMEEVIFIASSFSAMAAIASLAFETVRRLVRR